MNSKPGDFFAQLDNEKKDACVVTLDKRIGRRSEFSIKNNLDIYVKGCVHLNIPYGCMFICVDFQKGNCRMFGCDDDAKNVNTWVLSSDNGACFRVVRCASVYKI